MPNVAGREFSYTPQGMAAAEQYKQSLGMRGGGMMGFRPVGYQRGGAAGFAGLSDEDLRALEAMNVEGRRSPDSPPSDYLIPEKPDPSLIPLREPGTGIPQKVAPPRSLDLGDPVPSPRINTEVENLGNLGRWTGPTPEQVRETNKPWRGAGYPGSAMEKYHQSGNPLEHPGVDPITGDYYPPGYQGEIGSSLSAPDSESAREPMTFSAQNNFRAVSETAETLKGLIKSFEGYAEPVEEATNAAIASGIREDLVLAALQFLGGEDAQIPTSPLLPPGEYPRYRMNPARMNPANQDEWDAYYGGGVPGSSFRGDTEYGGGARFGQNAPDLRNFMDTGSFKGVTYGDPYFDDQLLPGGGEVPRDMRRLPGGGETLRGMRHGGIMSIRRR